MPQLFMIMEDPSSLEQFRTNIKKLINQNQQSISNFQQHCKMHHSKIFRNDCIACSDIDKLYKQRVEQIQMLVTLIVQLSGSMERQNNTMKKIEKLQQQQLIIENMEQKINEFEYDQQKNEEIKKNYQELEKKLQFQRQIRKQIQNQLQNNQETMIKSINKIQQLQQTVCQMKKQTLQMQKEWMQKYREKNYNEYLEQKDKTQKYFHTITRASLQMQQNEIKNLKDLIYQLKYENDIFFTIIEKIVIEKQQLNNNNKEQKIKKKQNNIQQLQQQLQHFKSRDNKTNKLEIAFKAIDGKNSLNLNNEKNQLNSNYTLQNIGKKTKLCLNIENNNSEHLRVIDYKFDTKQSQNGSLYLQPETIKESNLVLRGNNQTKYHINTHLNLPNQSSNQSNSRNNPKKYRYFLLKQKNSFANDEQMNINQSKKLFSPENIGEIYDISEISFSGELNTPSVSTTLRTYPSLSNLNINNNQNSDEQVPQISMMPLKKQQEKQINQYYIEKGVNTDIILIYNSIQDELYNEQLLNPFHTILNKCSNYCVQKISKLPKIKNVFSQQ